MSILSIFRLIDEAGKPQYCSAARAWEYLHRRPEPGLTLQYFDYQGVDFSAGRYKGEWRDVTAADLATAPLKVTRSLECPR